MTDEQWRAAWALCESAGDLEAEERRDFVRGATVDRDVESRVMAVFEEMSAGPECAAPPDQREGYAIGRYVLRKRIGQGGMGEVYAAEDTELRREIALKFLPTDLLTDKAASSRIIREARAASSLNHPHLVTVYEIIQTPWGLALGMELVEGQPLRALLKLQRISTERMIQIGRQIASALAAAHEKGIIHRDVKPENIMVRPDGYAKILDFGLARTAAALLGTGGSKSAELPAGTLRYMSPEQLRGEALTPATDVFSLGLIFYEFLHRGLPEVRDGEARLKFRPDVGEPELKGEVERLRGFSELTGWMLKDAHARPSAQQVAVALGRIEQRERSVRRNVLRWMAQTITLVCVVGVAVWYYKAGRGNEGEAVLQPVPFNSLSGSENTPAFSPDGKQIAYVWNGANEDNDDIYIQAIGSATPRRLTSNRSHDASPSWSPDGRQIAFLRVPDPIHLSVMVVPAVGGHERAVTTVTNYFDKPKMLTWAPDGRHVVTTDSGEISGTGPLVSISLEDGSKRKISSPGQRFTDWDPSFSPDGRNLAFIRFDLNAVEKLIVKAVGGSGEREIGAGGTLLNSVAWTPDSRRMIVSVRGKTGYGLWSIGLADGARRKLVLDARDARDVNISAKAGRIAYVEHTVDDNIWQFPTAGQGAAGKKVIASSRNDDDPSYSPDGKRIAFASTRSGPSEIWSCSSEGEDCLQLTHSGSSLCGSPTWSPDGREIAFDAHLEGNTDVYVVASDGSQMRRLTSGKGAHFVPSWSRNGRWIYFGWNRTGTAQIWKIAAAGGDGVQVTTTSGGDSGEAPDGKALYYANSSGVPGLHRLNFADGRVERIPGLDGLATCRYWEVRHAGIYFVDASAHPFLRLFHFGTGRISRLRPVPQRPVALVRGLSVSPDGRSFLVVQNDVLASNIMVVENFR